MYLMDFALSSSGELLPTAKPYFKALEEHVSNNPGCSYRSISNFNASYAAQTKPGQKYQPRVKDYIHLCDQIEAIDHKIMGVAAWAR